MKKINTKTKDNNYTIYLGNNILNLLKKKISVNYSDPYISRISIDVRKKKYLFKSLDLNIATLKKHDLTIILTAHDIFNYRKIAKHSNLLVDTRFVMNKYSSKVINI